MQLNPVLGRELKERVRGLRAFLTIGVFLGLLTATVWFVYIGNQGDAFGFDLERQTRLGRDCSSGCSASCCCCCCSSSRAHGGSDRR